MNDSTRLNLIAEAVRYCQRVRALGMPPAAFTKALREPVHFLWERRSGSKRSAVGFVSVKAATLRPGAGGLIYDHAFPFRYLQEALLGLDPVSSETVAEVLSRYGVIALITREEDDLLSASGYRQRMPADWNGVDPLARYKAVGIELRAAF